MPAEHRFIRERFVKMLVEIDHHLCDAALGERDIWWLRPKPELVT